MSLHLCPITGCGLSLASEASLTQHLETIHPNFAMDPITLTYINITDSDTIRMVTEDNGCRFDESFYATLSFETLIASSNKSATTRRTVCGYKKSNNNTFNSLHSCKRGNCKFSAISEDKLLSHQRTCFYGNPASSNTYS